MHRHVGLDGHGPGSAVPLPAEPFTLQPDAPQTRDVQVDDRSAQVGVERGVGAQVGESTDAPDEGLVREVLGAGARSPVSR